MESCVANPINTLIKLFVLPSNLIAKRHDKLLDYDGAQSTFEKAKEPQARQVLYDDDDLRFSLLATSGQTSYRTCEENLRSIEQPITRRITDSLRT